MGKAPRAPSSSDIGAPAAFEVFEHLSSQIDRQLGELSRVIESDAPAFGSLIGEAGLPVVGLAEVREAATAGGDD